MVLRKLAQRSERSDLLGIFGCVGVKPQPGSIFSFKASLASGSLEKIKVSLVMQREGCAPQEIKFFGSFSCGHLKGKDAISVEFIQRAIADAAASPQRVLEMAFEELLPSVVTLEVKPAPGRGMLSFKLQFADQGDEGPDEDPEVHALASFDSVKDFFVLA